MCQAVDDCMPWALLPFLQVAAQLQRAEALQQEHRTARQLAKLVR
jgi:hypothetical protein